MGSWASSNYSLLSETVACRLSKTQPSLLCVIQSQTYFSQVGNMHTPGYKRWRWSPRRQHTYSHFCRERLMCLPIQIRSAWRPTEGNPWGTDSAHTALSALGAVSHRERPSSRFNSPSNSSRLSRPLRQFWIFLLIFSLVILLFRKQLLFFFCSIDFKYFQVCLVKFPYYHKISKMSFAFLRWFGMSYSAELFLINFKDFRK